jgi:hypothetical protein
VVLSCFSANKRRWTFFYLLFNCGLHYCSLLFQFLLEQIITPLCSTFQFSISGTGSSRPKKEKKMNHEDTLRAPFLGNEEQEPPQKRIKVVQTTEVQGDTTKSSSVRFAEKFALLCHRRRNRKHDPEFDKLVCAFQKHYSKLKFCNS